MQNCLAIIMIRLKITFNMAFHDIRYHIYFDSSTFHKVMVVKTNFSFGYIYMFCVLSKRVRACVVNVPTPIRRSPISSRQLNLLNRTLFCFYAICCCYFYNQVFLHKLHSSNKDSTKNCNCIHSWNYFISLTTME